jgi:hypothetical protein
MLKTKPAFAKASAGKVEPAYAKASADRAAGLPAVALAEAENRTIITK